MSLPRRAFLGGALAAAAAPAFARARVAESAVSVLVDLSATWHNSASRRYNQRLLRSVGQAIVAAAQRLPRPIAVRYQIIGSGALNREPLCAVNFNPKLFAFGKANDPSEISDKAQFERYLTDYCPQYVVTRPAEATTEIGAAIIASQQAIAMMATSVPQALIILSDMKEDTQAVADLSGIGLSNTRVVILFRSLAEDARRPSPEPDRIRPWRKVFRKHNARSVTVRPDTAIVGSIAELTKVIAGE